MVVKIPEPGFESASNNLSIFNLKNNLWMFIPDPNFPFRIPEPGSRGQKKTPDPGSGSAKLIGVTI
jgi:hypothetical protein